ncbi:cysteine hydrolase family protein [Hypericibacter sp.]|uniref:cysteine hydrolase family protein n=1 Tax=Hypericibacter sp. TaxID=2705401 RepID=UPI003D6D9EFF
MPQPTTLAAQRPDDAALTREGPFDPKRTCLLLVDAQNYVWNPEVAKREPYFDKQLRETALPNLRKLIDGFRAAKAEVMYTVMENLTEDGRDRSLDYKLSKFWIAKGSWEAKVLDPLKPGPDDIVIPKTSSSVMNSTNIEYLLRNIGIDTLLVTGFLTDQCIDHTVRDAADRGFYPVCVTDGCATRSQERHDNAINLFKGYCRRMTTAEVLGWIGKK